ncbi:hypothetical protein D9M72_500800 [compost metagenome]
MVVALPRRQCHQNGVGQHHGSRHVHHRGACFDAFAICIAVHRHEAAFRLCDRIEAPSIRGLTTASVSRRRGVDQARVERATCLIPQAETIECAAGEILHQHVTVAHQILGDLQAGWILQIQDQALLVPIDPQEGHTIAWRARIRGRVVAKVVTATRRLYLDHLRTAIGEDHGRHGTGDEVREIQHTEPVQG